MLHIPPHSKYELTFKLAGLPVRVHPYFWPVAVILGWSDGSSLVTMTLWVGCVFVSILAHELGHALAARHFKAPGARIVLFSMGGLAIHNGRLTSRQTMIEILCGPAAGLLLYVLVWLASRVTVTFLAGQPYLAMIAAYLLFINLYWSVLNLLPVYPLDGGQLVREAISRKRPWQAMDMTLKISIVAATIAAIVAAISAVITQARGGDGSWMPAFLFAALAVMNYQSLTQHGGESGNRPNTARQSWERDPNWWKG